MTTFRDGYLIVLECHSFQEVTNHTYINFKRKGTKSTHCKECYTLKKIIRVEKL